MMDKIKRWLGTDKVCARYNDVSPRTIDRWIKTGVLPPPTYINGRRFWDEQELEARERNRAARSPHMKTAPS